MVRRSIPIVPLTLALLLAACQEVPQQDLDRSQQAVVELESSGASEWAPEEVAAARKALADVDAEVSAQGEKLALFRKYDKTKELSSAAAAKAAEAVEAAEAAREAARQEAVAAIGSVRSALERGATALAALTGCPKTPKGFASDLEALTARLQVFETSVPDLDVAVADGSYRQATTDATGLAGEVTLLAEEMETAQAKLGC